MEEENRLIAQRKQNLENLKKDDVNPYAYKFAKTNYAKNILEENKKLNKEGITKKNVSVAGRIMTIRIMGKAAFAHVQDSTGRIQIYAKEDTLGKKIYKLFIKIDIGDIIGVSGIVFRTKTGEISIWIKKFELLTKSLRPLPSNWYGLKDKELRYRRRYLDLIMNPEIKEIFDTRLKIIKAIREFLEKKCFTEVETPILQPIYGGTNARPFKSHLNALNITTYMRISNELYLKRLIVGTYEKIFEFSTDFRNEGIDKTHNPEFTQMETMWAYADYQDNMGLCQEMIKHVVKTIYGKLKIKLGNIEIDFNKWERSSFVDILNKYTKIKYEKVKTLEDAKEVARKFNIDTSKIFTKGQILAKIFEEVVKEKLIQPIIVYDYPIEEYVLAKEKRNNPNFAEAFEVYINGIEIGLSYSEQNNPEILKKYWKETEEFFKRGDEEAQRMDKDFIMALEYGMPPASGIGIGIDRLTMILTNSTSIRDIILFPFMKPEEF